MPYQYAKVELYRTLKVGTSYYTEGGIHRCAPQPTPESSEMLADMDIRASPKNADIFSILDIPIPEVPGTTTQYDLKAPLSAQPSFMVVTTVSNQRIYGWIDDIVMRTHAAPNASYRIRWHVDWWLTAGNLAVYGPGRMLRGPSSYARPDPALPRKWVFSDKHVLNDNFVDGVPVETNNMWVLLIYQKTDAEEHMTEVRYLSWQLGSTITSGGVTYQTVTHAELYWGLTEDKLSLDPNSIVGLYIIPFKPMGAGGSLHINNDNTIAAYDLGQTTNTTIINYSGSPSDKDRWIVTDHNGQTVGEIGWGQDFDSVVADVDIGTEGCYVRLRFLKAGADILGEGRIITVPAIAVPVTSNAMATYTYSGQREYDRNAARINQQQALTNSVANIGTTAIGGAIAGSMVAPGPGTVAGAVAGVAAGSIGAAVGYFSSGHYDKKAQENTDRLMSSQTGNLILSGSGYNRLYEWYLVHLVRDSVSAAELTTEQSELGYLTDTQVADCSSLIAAKGPLRIEGLQVFGLSPEGNRYISQMFARGVHLD